MNEHEFNVWWVKKGRAYCRLRMLWTCLPEHIIQDLLTEIYMAGHRRLATFDSNKSSIEHWMADVTRSWLDNNLRKLRTHPLPVELDNGELGLANKLQTFQPEIEISIPLLSSREVEVIRLLIAGETSASAGKILYVSKRTIDHHVLSIKKALNARTRTEAACKFLELERTYKKVIK